LTASQLEQIASAQRKVLTGQLLVRTPSPLSSETWARAAVEFVASGRRILASPREWYESPQVSDVVGTGYLTGVLLAVLATVVFGWYLRRWLIRSFGRKPAIAEPSYRMRVLAALAEATANTAIPILVVAVAYGSLLSRSLLFGEFQDLVLGISLAVVVFSVVRGLPRAILSPSLPHWRLVHLGDKAARLWYRRALTLAVIVSIDTLIVVPFSALEPTLLLSATYDFVVEAALVAVFLAAIVDKRLWWTPAEEAQAIAIKAGAPPGPPLDSSARRSRWWLAGRVLAGAVALAIPVTALAGYGVLADHIARRMVASAGVLVVGLILHGLARDLVAVLTREDEKPPEPDETANPLYVWTVLLLDIGVVVSIAIFLVPLWGGRWDNILERIGWAMSGFQIGGRTFSWSWSALSSASSTCACCSRRAWTWACATRSIPGSAMSVFCSPRWSPSIRRASTSRGSRSSPVRSPSASASACRASSATSFRV
jgi:small-conductance mechanosensitive channel